MAKYQLTAPAFIDSAFRATGEEVEFDGPPGPHMRALDKAAEAAQAELQAAPDTGVFTGFSGFPTIPPPVNVDVPYVGGVGAVGETLSCTMGNWEGEPTGYAYRWQRDLTEDVGAEDTYVIVAEDVGHSITCAVIATNMHGSTESPPSNAVLVEGAARSTEGRARR